MKFRGFWYYLIFKKQRVRDSNPRYLAVQRFSRPPRSTTPPTLCELFLGLNSIINYCARIGTANVEFLNFYSKEIFEIIPGFPLLVVAQPDLHWR